MYSISLLPAEYRQRTALKKRQRLLLLVFSFFLIILGMLLGFLMLNNTILQSQLESAFSYQKSLGSQMEILAPYENVYLQIELTSRIASEVGAEGMDWQDFLTQLGRNLPQGIMLTDLIANETKQKGNIEVRINGKAKNQMTVASYLNSLEQMSQVSSLQCRFISVGNNEDGETQFEIIMGVLQK